MKAVHPEKKKLIKSSVTILTNVDKVDHSVRRPKGAK